MVQCHHGGCTDQSSEWQVELQFTAANKLQHKDTHYIHSGHTFKKYDLAINFQIILKVLNQGSDCW